MAETADDDILGAREIARLGRVAVRTAQAWLMHELPRVPAERVVPVRRSYVGARRADVLALLARRDERAS